MGWPCVRAPGANTLGHQSADETPSGRDPRSALPQGGENDPPYRTGGIALQHARKVLQLNDEMIDTLRGSPLSGVVRIRSVQDFTGNVLPLVIERFTRCTRSSNWRSLSISAKYFLGALDSGDPDLALTLGGSHRKCAHVISQMPLHWMASPNFKTEANEPLPLALLSDLVFVRHGGLRC